MMLLSRRALRAAVLLPVAAFALTACGADSGATPLPAAADAGRATMRANGCASCHGADGQGGVGPAFQGLYGTEVALDDGSTVIADDEYLRTSIAEPGAQIVDGYRVPMPTNTLTDAEIDEIIAYIRAIGPVAEGDA